MRKEKTKNNPSTEEEKEVLSLSSEPSAQEPTAAAELSKEKTSEKEAVGGNEMPLENEGRDEQRSSLREEKEHEAVLSSPEKKDSSLKKETAFDAEKQNEESEKSEKDEDAHSAKKSADTPAGLETDEGKKTAPAEKESSACETEKKSRAEKTSAEGEERPEGEIAAPETAPRKKSIFVKIKERALVWKKVLFDEVNQRSTEIKHAKTKRILVTVGIGIFILCFAAFYFTVGKQIAFFVKKPEEFRDWLEGFGKSAIFIFLFLRVVQTVLKLIPGEALEIAAGCIFGTWEGLLWCLVGSIIGSLIIIFLGKKYGMKIVGLFVSPERMQSLSFLKNKKRLNFTFFLLYFIPGTPKDMFTWLVCLTDENPFLFILITSIARIPSIVTSTWCGHALIKGNYWLSAGILVGTILLAVIGGVIYKLTINKKKPQAAAAGEGEGENERDSEK